MLVKRMSFTFFFYTKTNLELVLVLQQLVPNLCLQIDQESRVGQPYPAWDHQGRTGTTKKPAPHTSGGKEASGVVLLRTRSVAASRHHSPLYIHFCLWILLELIFINVISIITFSFLLRSSVLLRSLSSFLWLILSSSIFNGVLLYCMTCFDDFVYSDQRLIHFTAQHLHGLMFK